MFHGPTLIYDKSAIQSFSEAEATWLHRQFHAVLTPTLYREVQAGLAKPPRAGRTEEEEVSTLADKIPNFAVTPTMHYQELVHMELFSEPVELQRKPYLAGAHYVQHSDGITAAYFDESPAAKALRNWSSGTFDYEDREMAQEWREEIAGTNFKALRGTFISLKERLKNLKTPESILAIIDQSLAQKNYWVLRNALNYLGIPEILQRSVVKRWIATDMPNFVTFAPYTAHVLRIDMLFMFCIARGLISDERASHAIDFSYFYYLPFTKIFTSGDKLHMQFAPLLIAQDQKFIPAKVLKGGLHELVEYHEKLSESQKQGGAIEYGRYPPVDGDYIVSKIFDEVGYPDWRLDAVSPPMPRDLEREKALLAQINKRLAEARASTNQD